VGFRYITKNGIEVTCTKVPEDGHNAVAFSDGTRYPCGRRLQDSVGGDDVVAPASDNETQEEYDLRSQREQAILIGLQDLASNFQCAGIRDLAAKAQSLYEETLARFQRPMVYKCGQCGQRITDRLPCGCGARPVTTWHGR
jgi:hypothetical protein